ncbi:MAG: iron-sulfur cluster assembly scaffold protein [Clostridiales bacterium]|jgi:nitrogen fixation NifU-like protein|nr:iron-sulfur cluster assembly scaffold protein [Clostridiales bacterium]
MYNERVIKEFSSPKNVGELSDANGVGQVGSAACGDIMRISMRINENDVIEDVKFKTFGCAAAIATSSVATDMIKGKTVDEALKLTNAAVVEELGGLPPQKLHCSVLAEEAIKAAVQDYLKRYKRDKVG